MTFMALIGLLATLVSMADEKFAWAPVTQKEWSVTADSAVGIRNAVMIFEKVTADDRNLGDGKSYLTVYRRVKILSAEGRRQFGDVTLPYVHERQRILSLHARTILPDGQEFIVGPSQVFEKDVVKSEGIHIKEMAFSLPGMTDDCIVEYSVRYELPATNSTWYIQKDVALLSGEYRWYPAPRTTSLEWWYMTGYEGLVLPNYLWLRDGGRGKVSVTKLEENSDLATFTIDSIAAYEPEDKGLAEGAVTTQLRLYYTSAKSTADYWVALSTITLDVLEEFGKKGEEAERFVATLDPGDSAKGRVLALYDWLQRNIRNIDYLDDDEREAGDYKVSASVDELLEHRYGTAFEINMAFFNLIKKMGVSSYPIYTVNRDEHVLVTDAKYWQFDGSLIAIPWQLSHPSYYSPGNPYLPAMSIPSVYEGTLAYVIEGSISRFKNLPFSSSSFSRSQCVVAGALGEDMSVKGTLKATFSGHEGRELRLGIHGKSATEGERSLAEALGKRFPKLKLESVRPAVEDSVGAAIALSASVSAPAFSTSLGGRTIVQPMGLLAGDENLFTAPRRTRAILFDYACEDRDILQLQLPPGYAVESLPHDTAVANRIGACEVKFSAFGQTLTVQELFKLNSPLCGADAYQEVQQLFRSAEGFRKLAVVLKR